MDSSLESAVREILTAWAASIPDHPFQDFGKSAAIVSIAEHPSFAVDLRTLYDMRQKPQEISKLYDETLAANLVTKPVPPESVDIWSFDPNLKKNDYVTQEATIDVPKTFRSISCSVCEGSGTWNCQVCSGAKRVDCGDCQGTGKKSCEKCNGRGKSVCTYCRGKGKTPGLVNPKDNKPAPDVECVNCHGRGGDPCDICNGTGGLPCAKCDSKGKLICSKCQGQGTQPCPQCAAKGKVLRGLSFKVSYFPRHERATAHDAETPKDLVPDSVPEGKAPKLLEKEGASVAGVELPSAAAHLKTALDGLVKQSESGKAGQAGETRVVAQLLRVERIPVYAVVYRYAGKIFDVWLTALDNKAVAKESPFKDFAREQAMKAMALASKGQHAEAQQLLSKARAIAGGDISLEHAEEVHSGTATQGFFGIHQVSSGVAGLALMAVLGASQGPTFHLFWPVFSFGLIALGVALGAGLAIAKFKSGWIPHTNVKRAGISALVAALCAASAAGAFSVARLPLKLDSREFQQRLSDRLKSTTPDAMGSDDRDFLKFLILTYEPLGVDVSPAQKAIEDSLRAIEEAKRQAEARAEAERQAKIEAERKAQEVRELEAARKKSAKKKKTKTSKNTKKKKKSWLFGR